MDVAVDQAIRICVALVKTLSKEIQDYQAQKIKDAVTSFKKLVLSECSKVSSQQLEDLKRRTLEDLKEGTFKQFKHFPAFMRIVVDYYNGRQAILSEYVLHHEDLIRELLLLAQALTNHGNLTEMILERFLDDRIQPQTARKLLSRIAPLNDQITKEVCDECHPRNFTIDKIEETALFVQRANAQFKVRCDALLVEINSETSQSGGGRRKKTRSRTSKSPDGNPHSSKRTKALKSPTSPGFAHTF